MTDVTLFNESEVAERADFQRIGELARAGDEAIVGGAIAYPQHWARFSMSAPSSMRVRVSAGSLFADAVVYDLEAPADVDLTVHRPLVLSDQRYVALLARGRERAENRTGFVESDVETGATVPVSLPKFARREVFFTVQEGIASPTPQRPEIAATDCCIGFVLLDTNGIAAIESGQDWRVKTLFEIDGRVTVLEGQMIIAFQRTLTLETDLAQLQARFNDVPRHETVFQLQRDVSRVRRMLDLPDEARGYFYDPGLVTDQWDLQHGSFLGRINEGLRLTASNERDERLEILNPAQAGIRVENNLLMPTWREVNVITVDGPGSTKNISQQVHEERRAVQRSIARSSVSYGPTVAMCDNVQEWAQIGKVREGQQFQVAGETFQKVNLNQNITGIDTSTFNQVHNSNYRPVDVVMHNAQMAQTGYREIYAARSVQVSHWTDTYWDYVTDVFGVNGSVYGQSFLLTQPTTLTSIELPFDRVAADGAVNLLLVEVDPTGAPLFDAVIARSTTEAKDLEKGWNRFGFAPRYLKPGKRYAWITVTTGNHSLRTVTGAKYAEGTLFWSTDQAWFQGSPEEDFAFKLNGAEFAANRVVVDFHSLTLENGMTELQLLYEAWAPEGTSMMWEVKPFGRDEWERLQPETDEAPNPLRGLPASTQLRLVMQGTSRLAPAINLTATARGITRRPRNDGRFVTKLLNFGYATKKILVEVVVDQFDPAKHTCVPRIRNGNALIPAEIVSVSQDLSKSTRRIVRASFVVPDLTSARLQIDLETNNIQFAPFGENVSLYAL